MPYTFKHGDRPLEGITVQRAVGRGGFGEVYYALTDSGKQIALKFLRENPEIELRGISHVMNLKSPHLITIYDVKRNADGDPFVLMEYVSGPSLRDLMLAEPEGLGPQKAAFFVDGVAKGLTYLHERGIVHRDLKPANIFYDDGYVKIGDYGLSKHMSVSQHSGQTVSVGTVHYMAPEIGSGNYTKAIDIYALGVILYELLTGRLPFSGSSMGEILMRHLSERPNLTSIPEPFAAVIAKALAKDPLDRYQDVNEMADVLRQHGAIAASVSSFDPATLTRRPRDPAAVDPENTLTTPAPAPAMDVRAAAMGRGLPERLAERMQKKVDKLAQKLQQRGDRLRHRHGSAVRLQWSARPSDPGAASAHRASRGQRGYQLFVVVAVAIAVAIGLAFVHGGRDPQAAGAGAALAFAILAGTFAPLLTYFKILSRSPARSPLWDKLSYGAVTGLLLIPAFGVASKVSGSFARIMCAPLALLLLCDWTRRIEAGRRGVVSGGQAFWPAILGLIVASVLGARGYEFLAACMCAAISLLTQAAAAIWPRERSPVDGATSAREPAGSFSADREALSTESAALGAMHKQEMSAPPPPPQHPLSRVIFTILSVLVGSAAPAFFFALVVGQPKQRDECAGLLFATLASVAALPVLISKARQKVRLPLWRGVLRPLIMAACLCLMAGMIGIMSFERLQADELAAAVFGLVLGGVSLIVVSSIRGQHAVRQPPRTVGLPAAVSASADREPIHRVPSESAAPRAAAALEPAERTPVATAAGSAAPLVIDAAAPSFVGRAADAGLGFLGKLLLLAALALAVGQTTFLGHVDDALVRAGAHLDLRTRQALLAGLPGPAILGTATVGSALLLLARRRGGAAHLLRGCAGCTFGLWGTVMALGPAASAWRILLSAADWSTLDWNQIGEPLALTAIPLVVAFVFLTWPRRRENTVVV